MNLKNTKDIFVYSKLIDNLLQILTSIAVRRIQIMLKLKDIMTINDR